MLFGIVCVMCGLLILIYPPLLSIIVACMLIFIGISLCFITRHLKKNARSLGSPYADFFIRF